VVQSGYSIPAVTTAPYHTLVRQVLSSLEHVLQVAPQVRSMKSLVLPILLHGCETWTLTQLMMAKLEGFLGRTLRQILRLRWQDQVPYEDIRHRTGMYCQGPIAWHVRYRQLRWFGHVVRMSPDRWPSQILFGRPPDSAPRPFRPQTRPPSRWIDNIYDHLACLGISTDDPLTLRNLLEDRSRWRELIKTPMPCVLCANATSAREAAQEVIESILASIGSSDRPKRPRSPSPPPLRSKCPRVIPNPAAIRRGLTEPWHFSTTIPGPTYGQSRSGRMRVRSRDYPATTPQCPMCQLPSPHAQGPPHHCTRANPQPQARVACMARSIPNGDVSTPHE